MVHPGVQPSVGLFNQVTNAFRSSEKFFTMLLLVEMPKFLEGEVLSQNLGPRRLKFRFEVLLWIPPQTEVTRSVWSWWSSKRRDLSNWSCSRGELHRYWSAVPKTSRSSKSSLNKKICNKNEVCQSRRPVFPAKQWSTSPPNLPRKLASGLKFQRKIKSCSQFEVHASMATKWQKKTTYEVGSIEVKKHGSSVSEFFFQVHSWSFPAIRSSPNHKVKRNEVKYHGYPKLPGSV